MFSLCGMIVSYFPHPRKQLCFCMCPLVLGYFSLGKGPSRNDPFKTDPRHSTYRRCNLSCSRSLIADTCGRSTDKFIFRFSASFFRPTLPRWTCMLEFQNYSEHITKKWFMGSWLEPNLQQKSTNTIPQATSKHNLKKYPSSPNPAPEKHEKGCLANTKA